MQHNMQTGRCLGWGERMFIDPVLSQQIPAEPGGLQSWGLQLWGRGDALLQLVHRSSSKTQLNQRGTCNSATNDYILVKAGCTAKTLCCPELTALLELGCVHHNAKKEQRSY